MKLKNVKMYAVLALMILIPTALLANPGDLWQVANRGGYFVARIDSSGSNMFVNIPLIDYKAPVNTATTSVVGLGKAIASGNTASNGGTFLGINEPASGAGSAADFVNFQANGVSKFKINKDGNITFAGTLTGSISPTTPIDGVVIGGVTPAAGTFTTLKGTISGFKRLRTATATSYSVLVTDSIVGVTSTAAARTITLPSPAAAGAGWSITVVDESGAAGTNNITVVHNAAETINGTAVISTNFGKVTFYTDGTNWFAL